MGNSIFKLDKILDLKKWQLLQDSLAQVTQLAIITVDYKGIPITEHSGCKPFCQQVRQDPELSKRCQKCDSRGGLEAVRSGMPFIYLCHYDIIDIAIPISVADKYVGAVMAGQIRLDSMDGCDELEQILSSRTSIHSLHASAQLQTLYDQLPVLTYHNIDNLAKMLFHLCNYIVDEAKNKNYILEMYENLVSVNPGSSHNVAVSIETEDTKSILKMKGALANAVTSSYITDSCNSYISKNLILQPVFDYIYENKNKFLSLNDAAALCFLSPSYFSRIFTKETNKNYTSYIASLKVVWAKQLLERTTLSVTQISDELGFNDPGYFIKIFKKQEHFTPSVYRKYSLK